MARYEYLAEDFQGFRHVVAVVIFLCNLRDGCQADGAARLPSAVVSMKCFIYLLLSILAGGCVQHGSVADVELIPHAHGTTNRTSFPCIVVRITNRGDAPFQYRHVPGHFCGILRIETDGKKSEIMDRTFQQLLVTSSFIQKVDEIKPGETMEYHLDVFADFVDAGTAYNTTRWQSDINQRSRCIISASPFYWDQERRSAQLLLKLPFTQ